MATRKSSKVQLNKFNYMYCSNPDLYNLNDKNIWIFPYLKTCIEEVLDLNLNENCATATFIPINYHNLIIDTYKFSPFQDKWFNFHSEYDKNGDVKQNSWITYKNFDQTTRFAIQSNKLLVCCEIRISCFKSNTALIQIKIRDAITSSYKLWFSSNYGLPIDRVYQIRNEVRIYLTYLRCINILAIEEYLTLYFKKINLSNNIKSYSTLQI